MKTIVTTVLLALLGTGTALADGAINFSNGAAGVNVPVQSGSANAGFTAELLMVTTNATVSVTKGVPVQTGDLAGYFFGGAVEIPNTVPGQTVTLEVRIWYAAQVAATSDPVQIPLGGDIIPPANLVGLRFDQAQVRPMLNIRLEGNQLILSWDASFGQYAPEFVRTLGDAWSALGKPVSPSDGQLEVTISPGSATEYFRLRAN